MTQELEQRLVTAVEGIGFQLKLIFWTLCLIAGLLTGLKL